MPGKVSAGTKRKDPPAKKAESSEDDDSSEEETVAKKPVAVKAQPAAKGKAAAKKVGTYSRGSDIIYEPQSWLAQIDIVILPH